MKVYLDDIRKTPKGWVRKHWPREVIDLLDAGIVTHLSLDHDLGKDQKGTGYDVLTWIEEAVATRGFVPPKIEIHSANPAAFARMQQAIARIDRFRVKSPDIYPDVAMITQDLVSMLLEALPDHIDRVILHGSSINGKFREGISDVDIAVLMNGRPEKFNFMTMYDIEKAINERFKGPWKRIEVAFVQSDNAIKYRNFASCYFGSLVNNGIDLYDTGREIPVEPLSSEEARSETINSYIRQAWSWTADARMTAPYYSGMTSAYRSEKSDWHACRAVSRILQAIILKNDRDDHLQGKSNRWDLQKQFAAVVESHPELIDLKLLIDALPQLVAHKDIEDLDDCIDDAHDSASQRRVIAIALTLIRKISSRHFSDKTNDGRKIYGRLKRILHHDHFRRTNRD